ncbi:hypothetical protein N566_12840 [Streptomycetaceae bacterium MP113-05]|nr:hypothetical protein N566_12840 [Streptomycetaceae bacterium MP113-05]
MAQAARTRQAAHGPRSFLNSDGKPHPRENGVAAAALLLGVVALLTGLLTQVEVADLHLVASWVGLAGVVAAGWGQYVSATLGERFLLVIGLGTAAFGMFLGFAYGGPFGGVLG